MMSHEAPVQWSKRRLRFDARINPLKSKIGLAPLTEVSFVPMDAISELGGLQLNETRLLEEVYNGYTYFANGDVCVAKITPCFENGKGALAQGLTNGVAFGTTELHVIRPLAGLDAHFLYYLTTATDFRSRGAAEMIGAGGQKRVPEAFLKDWRPALPALETQRRIARSLDDKTSRIDRLIEKKRMLLERLAEKRQALITRAVTKGLAPTAPMKPSGIGWLGDIPAHWKTGNIRRFAQMKTGHTPSRSNAEYWDDCTIPWFTLADVWQLRDGTRWYLEETAEKISEIGLDNSAAELLPAGTVVFSRTASIGYSGIMPVAMATSQDFWNWICGPKLTPEYLLLLFRSMTQKFQEITNGSTHQTIYQGIAAGLEICVPPLEEQRAIAAFVFDRAPAIDVASDRVRKSIEKMTEYRAALVTSAVTGKLEGLQ